jgi:hypothetical protein
MDVRISDVMQQERDREIRKATEGFLAIHPQIIDARAAFERLDLTRKTLDEYFKAINATNTAGIPESLKAEYNALYAAFRCVEASETMLVHQGK